MHKRKSTDWPAGSRNGRLIVVGHVRGRGRTRLSVACDCGTKKTVLPGNMSRTLSCGCWRKEEAESVMWSEGRGAVRRTHGRSGTREHIAWMGAKSRCSHPSNHAFRSYGARGIRMCREWSDSFEHFLRDMGPRPAGATLDRIDNDGPYAPGNCRWATPKQQANNRRLNHYLSYDGKRLTLAEWAEVVGLDYATVSQRINKLGWTPARALTTAPRPPKRTHA